MNEEMVERLVEAKSAAEVQIIANEYGKELSTDEAAELLAMVQSANAAEVELSDDALAAVTGGNMWGMTDEEYEEWRLRFLEKLDAKSKGRNAAI